MSPRLHLVRHGKGRHQIAPKEQNDQRHDPDLTRDGIEQCRTFSSNFPTNLKIDLLCASPIRRTIQTAQHCFSGHLRHTSGKILLLPYAQEVGDDPSDTGSPYHVLQDEFGDVIDVSLVEENWNSNDGIYDSSCEVLHERAKQLRRWLRERPEKEIAICGHSVFWHFFTDDVDEEGMKT
ncbi:hypothetical protein D6D08_10124, partial [Aureobasidium pullulans]